MQCADATSAADFDFFRSPSERTYAGRQIDGQPRTFFEICYSSRVAGIGMRGKRRKPAASICRVSAAKRMTKLLDLRHQNRERERRQAFTMINGQKITGLWGHGYEAPRTTHIVRLTAQHDKFSNIGVAAGVGRSPLDGENTADCRQVAECGTDGRMRGYSRGMFFFIIIKMTAAAPTAGRA